MLFIEYRTDDKDMDSASWSDFPECNQENLTDTFADNKIRIRHSNKYETIFANPNEVQIKTKLPTELDPSIVNYKNNTIRIHLGTVCDTRLFYYTGPNTVLICSDFSMLVEWLRLKRITLTRNNDFILAWLMDIPRYKDETFVNEITEMNLEEDVVISEGKAQTVRIEHFLLKLNKEIFEHNTYGELSTGYIEALKEYETVLNGIGGNKALMYSGGYDSTSLALILKSYNKIFTIYSGDKSQNEIINKLKIPAELLKPVNLKPTKDDLQNPYFHPHDVLFRSVGNTVFQNHSTAIVGIGADELLENNKKRELFKGRDIRKEAITIESTSLERIYKKYAKRGEIQIPLSSKGAMQSMNYQISDNKYWLSPFLFINVFANFLAFEDIQSLVKEEFYKELFAIFGLTDYEKPIDNLKTYGLEVIERSVEELDGIETIIELKPPTHMSFRERGKYDMLLLHSKVLTNFLESYEIN